MEKFNTKKPLDIQGGLTPSRVAVLFGCVRHGSVLTAVFLRSLRDQAELRHRHHSDKVIYQHSLDNASAYGHNNFLLPALVKR